MKATFDEATQCSPRCTGTKDNPCMIALNRRAEADRDANAKLREAAPDMLAALRIIAADEPDLYCACMALGWFGDGHNAECPVGIAENAIAKAEGRAHA